MGAATPEIYYATHAFTLLTHSHYACFIPALKTQSFNEDSNTQTKDKSQTKTNAFKKRDC